MIRTSQVDSNNNIETTVMCKACGHKCKEVYVVKDNSIQDIQESGDKFIKTTDKVVPMDKEEVETHTVYMCPKCGVLQTEVAEV